MVAWCDWSSFPTLISQVRYVICTGASWSGWAIREKRARNASPPEFLEGFGFHLLPVILTVGPGEGCLCFYASKQNRAIQVPATRWNCVRILHSSKSKCTGVKLIDCLIR